jgi:hypothetical protein
MKYSKFHNNNFSVVRHVWYFYDEIVKRKMGINGEKLML